MAQQPRNDRVAVEGKNTNGMSLLWVLGALVIVAMALFLLIPLFSERGSAGVDSGVTINEITANPAQYYGQTVTVSGEVDERIGDRAFAIGGKDFIGGNELLVVSANQLPAVADRPNASTLAANDLVQVTGPVREFNLGVFEKEIGADLDDALFTDYTGKPAVVARSLDLTPRAEMIDGTQPIIADANVAVAEIVANPANYIGKTVLVRGDVNTLVTPHAFTLDESSFFTGGIDNDLLVVSPGRMSPINEGFGEQNVQVQGTVRQFDLQVIENELGLDFDDNVFADWSGRTVLVANSVQAANGHLARSTSSVNPGTSTDGTSAANNARDEGNVTVAEISSNAANFIGQQVTVKGQVNSLINPQAFTLDEDALLAGGIDNDLLVIGVDQRVPFNEGIGEATVRVEGTVRAFNLTDVETEIGYDLDDNLFVDWAERPAIVAKSVTQLEPVTPPAEAGMTGDIRNTTVAEITSNASNFIGQNVAVSEEVEEVIGGDAFVLDEDALLAGGIDNDLLVLRGMQDMAAFADDIAGETMLIFGQVQSFNLADIESQIGYDLDDTMFADWAGRPVIIAKSVQAIE